VNVGYPTVAGWRQVQMSGGVMLRIKSLLLVLVLGATACSNAPFVRHASDAPAVYFYGSGTGAGLEFMKALSARFSAIHPEVHIELQDVGQDTAVANVALGRADFGFISRDLKTDEIGRVRVLRFAETGTGIAVPAANVISGLTTEDVRRIYTGEVTNWAQLGGSPGPIDPFLREPGSATRSSFEAWFFDGAPKYGPRIVEVTDSAPMIKAIHDNRAGVGMITIQKATIEDEAIRVLAIDGIAATPENVQADVYPVRRPIILLLPPDAGSAVVPQLRAFFDFIDSPEGAKIISSY
jgi:phosphate transport system substrate-binding protein